MRDVGAGISDRESMIKDWGSGFGRCAWLDFSDSLNYRILGVIIPFEWIFHNVFPKSIESFTAPYYMLIVIPLPDSCPRRMP